MAIETIFAKNLKYLMRQHNFNTVSLSRQTTIPQPTLHHILSGKTKKPRSSVIKVLAEFFNCSSASLLQEELKQGLTGIKSISLLSWSRETQCFKESAVQDSVIGYYSDECFAFFVNREDCHTSWPNQSLAIIAKDQSPKEGSYGLVFLKPYGLTYADKEELFIKYATTNDDFWLLKLNGNWLGQLIELRLMGHEGIDGWLG